MKKTIFLSVIILLFFTGCSNGDNADIQTGAPNDEYNNVSTKVYSEVYNSEIEHEGIKIPDISKVDEPLNSGEEVETNINGEELSKDKQLTDDAENNQDKVSDIVDPKEIESVKDSPDYNEVLLKAFESKVPEEIELNIVYDKYQVPKDYLLIMSGGANIREKPSISAKVIRTASYFEKINLISEVQGEFLDKYGTDKWYKVAFKAEDKVQEGYILSKLAQPRTFQFDKMVESVNNAKSEIDANTSAYISNYKNRIGAAPLYKGSTKDKFGIQRHQSAPAYYEPNLGSEFRYFSDGTIVSVLAETESFYKVRAMSFEGEYYVPKKYVSYRETIEALTKVIVVDRKNQNEGVFELIEGKWNLISYTYATTGENARHKLPTDLGYFMAIEKVSRFLYLSDTTKQIAGYAPYGIRFNGGAYIHGVPVDYVNKNGKRIDPGMQEYLYTIGTVPKSHKCVRNYTSHAKFLYDWIEIGKSIVIVIE